MTRSNNRWLIQLALIEEIAAQPKSSIEKLHFSFIEKLGQPPEFEHIDYFVAITDIPDNDIVLYLKYIGRPEPKRKNGTLVGGRSRARSIVSSNILDESHFRQTFEQEYGRPPSEWFVQHYLQKSKRQRSRNEQRNDLAFTNEIVKDPQATILSFRQQFSKKFGTIPSEELIQYFLLKNQKRRIRSSTESPEMHFASTGANGSLTTVLEFRRSFLQEFGKKPDADVTKAFIAGLTSGR